MAAIASAKLRIMEASLSPARVPASRKTTAPDRPVSGLALLARIAFPWTLHSGVLMRLDALTVAGAAQVAFERTALAVPASRLTRRAEGAAGTELARRL
jgi:hypothetical protein